MIYTFPVGVDNNIEQKVVGYFGQLGLSREEAELYLYILRHGRQTALMISRGLKTGRTKIYAHLDKLACKQLVVVHERHYGTSYEAANPEVIEFLVNEQEREASQLRGSLPDMLHLLSDMRASSPEVSKVVDYRGVDGLKQMRWNINKAGGEFRVFESSDLNKNLDNHFTKKLNQALYLEKKLKSLVITNNFGKGVTPLGIPNVRDLLKTRYIEPKTFKITFETYIYNDCVALLTCDTDDIFGVEFYNPALVSQQKQLFDLIWRMGTSPPQ
jgi:sugar-specific transcriptional regulator TrmB